MGNQLTGTSPSQILPVEHYLTDSTDYEYQVSLGSTRFFKVARAKCKEGEAVVKVFVIHDPSLPLKSYMQHIEDIQTRLQGASNCLPFQRATLSDKAALLYRQYVKDSLYDRISTRPFLNNIEKKWIAFQLLCALNRSHKLNVCHGDIKSENVMVTSWNWLLLADFASFKPTYLPEDNPADFSFFFDTSRRRTCYIAPERFVESSWRQHESSTQSEHNIDLTNTDIKTGDLQPAMDIFSAGCVIAELFTEGSPPFDLSQLLVYRTGDYSPTKVLQKIEDPHIRDLVKHMIQTDPGSRKSAEQYLMEQRSKAFPEYFYIFLKLYLQRYASLPILTADERILRVKRDLKLILQHLGIREDGDPAENTVLVLIISLITSSLRELHQCGSKLTALELLSDLAKYVTADIILDRLLPFMLYFVNDPFPRVRAEAIRIIAHCLAKVKVVPINDANIFPEYILPAMSPLAGDSVVLVRVAYAENIALLAETALRFLEIVQLSNHSNNDPDPTATTAPITAAARHQGPDHDVSQYKASYDAELQALHEMIQQKVVTLLSDSDNVVKQTLLMSGITRLCVFFGRQKANDILLSHMITFLNDKRDWHLRGAFFESIVGVAAYVGWQSSTILKPLLQQGLSDIEEFVIHKTLCTLTSLTELGLLQKPVLHELMSESVPLFCHPNLWIRQGAVGFVCGVARHLNIADVHCNVLPLIKPFLTRDIIQLDKEVVLLDALTPPISRSLYDYILRSPLVDALFDMLQDRQLMRNVCRPGHSPNYAECEENITQMLRKLASMGMTATEEDKLLAMKDFLQKLHRARAGSQEPPPSPSPLPSGTNLSSGSGSSMGRQAPGKLNVSAVQVRRRFCDLAKTQDTTTVESATPSAKKAPVRKKPGVPESPTTTMNEDWKQMFGAATDLALTSAPGTTHQRSKVSPTHPAQFTPGGQGSSGGRAEEGKKSAAAPSGTTTVVPMPHGSGDKQQAIHTKYSACRMELRSLIVKKREQYQADVQYRDLLDNSTWEDKPLPPHWKPKGQLVAHLHEHRGAVNRIRVSPDHSYFATCSNDGSVKIFDVSRMEGKSVTNRSRHTYNKQGGQIKSITFCDNSNSIAAASDSGSIHVFRIESSGQKLNILRTENLDVEQEGLVVDLNYADTGSQNIIIYATVNGLIKGMDLRSPNTIWKLKNEPKHGLITSFDFHPGQSWLAVGTSNGTHVCWDMRFHLPITKLVHPTGARVRRLLCHPGEQSCLVSAVQGNNEVSMWDLETGARQKTLWASTAPALSLTQATHHSINGMYLGVRDQHQFLLTAGSDMRLRYWDLGAPANSHIVALAASDPVTNQTAVSYRARLIEGVEVMQETYGRVRGGGGGRTPAPAATSAVAAGGVLVVESPRRGPDTPPTGHHDVITDVTVAQAHQCFVVTSSREGVVKVWK